MQKIKQFIKKYWFWLIIVSILILAILLFVVLLNIEDDEEIDIHIINKIESPYYILGYDVNIELKTKEEGFKKREPVLEVSRTPNPTLENFLTTFVSPDIDFDIYKDLSYSLGGVHVIFNSNTSQMIISRLAGRWLINNPIFSESDIETFMEEFLGVNTENVLVEKDQDGGTLYRGFFRFQDINVGTITLRGYAYEIIVREDGQLEELTMLVIQESDILNYQNIPTSSLSDILDTDSRYPMKIVHKTFSKSIYDKHPIAIGSTTLENLSVTDIENLYIFNTFDTPYIYPTYKLTGDGIVKDYEGDIHRSLTEVYICAISPEYLYEKRSPLPEPHGHPFF